MDAEPELVFSDLGQKIDSDGKTVEVEIYRMDNDERWCLEVTDEFGNSSVWEDTFATDVEALDEVNTAIREETIDSFIGPADGQSEGEWK